MLLCWYSKLFNFINITESKTMEDSLTADTNNHYTIYRAELYNNQAILYFDKNWDIQETTLQDIVSDDDFLSDFRQSDKQILIALSSILNNYNK